MGFFDRLKAKQPAAPVPLTPSAVDPNAAALPKLTAAREKLDSKDLTGAMALYEEVLLTSGDRADVLVRISGDLGATGNIPQVVELIAPRYDAERHGPATGINLVQAYLALRDPEAAQHVLDILYSLNRPELEQRLHGFSNAIAEVMTHGDSSMLPPIAEPSPPPGMEVRKVALISISKPIWAYGLEELFPELLPEKKAVRRIAFAQLALPGAYPDFEKALTEPSDELQRLSRAIPMWLAEVFAFSENWSPIAGIASLDLAGAPKRPMIFAKEWTAENLSQLMDSATEPVDYAFTGALIRSGEKTTLKLKVWEVKKMKDRKDLAATWTDATIEEELAKVSAFLRTFMEWKPASTGLPYTPPQNAQAWLQALSLSTDLFLADKNLIATDLVPPIAPVADALSPHACDGPAESLAWLTMLRRAKKLGIAPSLADIQLSQNHLVGRARDILLV